jgi:hypothetical protein
MSCHVPRPTHLRHVQNPDHQRGSIRMSPQILRDADLTVREFTDLLKA